MKTNADYLERNIDYFNDVIAREFLKFGDTNYLQAIIDDDGKPYICDGDDKYEIGTRDVEFFIQEHTNMKPFHRVQILNLFLHLDEEDWGYEI